MESLYARCKEALEQDLTAAQAGLLRYETIFYKFFTHLNANFRFPHDLTHAAVLVPIIDRASGPTVLLTYRTDDMPTHPGDIVFPGGGRKAGDLSLIDTALREAEEEIGLARAQVRIAGLLDARPMGPRYAVQPVIGIVAGDTQFTHCAREMAAVFELPLQRMLDLQQYRNVTERGQLQLPVRNLRFGEHFIWGATADILWDLRARLSGDGKA